MVFFPRFRRGSVGGSIGVNDSWAAFDEEVLIDSTASRDETTSKLVLVGVLCATPSRLFDGTAPVRRLTPQGDSIWSVVSWAVVDESVGSGFDRQIVAKLARRRLFEGEQFGLYDGA